MVYAIGGKTIDTIKGARCLRLRSALLLGSHFRHYRTIVMIGR